MPPQGGSEEMGETILSLKVLFYYDNSNANSFSSIENCGGKLFNFLTFLDILGGKNGKKNCH